MYLDWRDLGLLGLDKLQALDVTQLAIRKSFFVGMKSSILSLRLNNRLKTRSIHCTKENEKQRMREWKSVNALDIRSVFMGT